MTEQQANNPIDNLFRETFENLPDTPAASGWDQPSDRVWQNIQSNIQPAPKTWGMKAWVLLAGAALTLAAGIYWIVATPDSSVIPASTPPQNEQTVETPAAATPETTQTTTVQEAKPGNTGKQPAKSVSKPGNTVTKPGQPEKTGAQPLPGSKTTLPPNSTEAQKNNSGGNN